MTRLIVLALAVSSLGASCRTFPEDTGPFAAEAGHATIVIRAEDSAVLGSCDTDFALGWGHCLLERGQETFPELQFVMTRPGEWAVGDCELGLYKSGSTQGPELVTVDLSGLRNQIERIGMCILKVETFEYYPDPRSSGQQREVYTNGGFFVELIAPGYFPVPANEKVAFCVKVMRTTRGRTKIEGCTPE